MGIQEEKDPQANNESELYIEANKRIKNIMILNNTLKLLKDLSITIGKLSPLQKQVFSEISNLGINPLTKNFYEIAQTILLTIDNSSRENDTFQNISGVKPKEVNAIDLSEAEIPIIVSRNSNVNEPAVLVSLSDLDKYRQEETSNLAQMIKDDPKTIQTVRQQMGGYVNDNIFTKDN